MSHGFAQVPGEWRLLLPALIAWISAAMLVQLPGLARIVGVGALCLGTILVILVVRGAGIPRRPGVRRWVGMLASLLIVCGGLVALTARIDLGERARNNNVLVRLAEGKRQVEVQVRIAGYPAPLKSAEAGARGVGNERARAGSAQAWVRAELEYLPYADIVASTSAGADATDADPRATPKLPSRVPVVLWLPERDQPELFPGAQVVASGSLSRAPPAGGAAFLMNVTSLTAVETVSRGPVERLLETLGRTAATLRTGLAGAATTIPAAALVPGFAVGDTSLVSAELDALMQESSLTHLTAVSGSNCALVIAAVTWLAARMGAGRRVRLLVAAAGLSAFVVVVGPDASVQRAAIMGGVLLVSNFGGRRGQALPALGIAILTLLLADPWQAMQPGFALSVAATGGILLAGPRAESWIRRRLRIHRVLALPLAITVVVQLACAPLLLLLQPGLPMAGVLANLLAAPVAPAGTALGLVALVTLPMSGTLGGGVIWVAAWTARWIEAAGALSVALPGARWHWPGGPSGAVLLAGVYVLVLVALGLLRIDIVPWRGRRRDPRLLSVRLVRVFAGAAAGVVVGVTVVVPLAARLGVPNDWAVVACDVGQGDATLIRNPKRPDYVMLIDTGEEPEKLRRCLDLFRVKEVALLAITHNHQDHVGAVDVVAGFTQQGLAGPESEESKRDGVPAVIDVLRGAGIPSALGRVGLTSAEFTDERVPAIDWRLLGPPDGTVFPEPNSSSLVFRVEIEGIRFLLLADTGEAQHRELLSNWGEGAESELKADVVKVAHHGSKDQYERFYEVTDAGLAFVSVGASNRYGHPNRALLEGIAKSGTSVLRTDTQGSIALSVRGGRLEAWVAGVDHDQKH